MNRSMCSIVKLSMCLALVFALAPSAFAATLKIGDPAPPIAVGKWVKGDPVEKFEPGKVYVMEFWATWCGPCVKAIPHITELQKQYDDKGLVVIGTSVWENDAEQSKVMPFVEKMGEKMDYRVAMDDRADGGKGKMAETWMAAAGRNGIPCSFIVDKSGTIAWIGHPMAMDEVIPQVLDGTWDKSKAAAELEEQNRKMEAQAAKMKELRSGVDAAIAGKDYQGAWAMLEAEGSPMKGAAAGYMANQFVQMLRNKDYANAYSLASFVEKNAAENPMAMNVIAWSIVDLPGVERRDMALAERCAENALKASKGQDAAILDTVARVHFENGRIDKAIEYQTLAVAKAEGDMKEELAANLKKYEAAKK